MTEPIISREQEKRWKEEKARLERKLVEENEHKDVIETAKVVKDFINDLRYARYKEILLALKDGYEIQRKNLYYTVKDNDEYIRKGISYDAKISVIEWILNTPDDYMKELAKEKEDKRNGNV